MRIRSIKPEFWRDEVTGLMAAEVALFYLGICSYCDDSGRFQWNPVLIQADLDPYGAKFGGPEEIEKLLASLERLHRVRRYSVNGKAYGVMPSFGKHQKPQHPAKSKFPEPPPTPGESSRHDAESYGTPHEDYGSPHERYGKTLHGDGDGVGDGVGELLSCAAAPPAAPALLTPSPPKTDRPPAAKKGGKPGTDPRFAPLRAAWCEEYRARYGTDYDAWGPADAQGLHRRLAVPPEVFRERARRGLAARGFEQVATCAELCSSAKWARLAGNAPAATGPPARRAMAPVSDWDDPAKANETL